jgi:hypothetical protein
MRHVEAKRLGGLEVDHQLEFRGLLKQPIRSTGWSSGPDRKPAWHSKRTRTCSVTPAATRWRMPVTIPARCRITSDTRTSSTPCVIPNWRQLGLRISGANRVTAPPAVPGFPLLPGASIRRALSGRLRPAVAGLSCRRNRELMPGGALFTNRSRRAFAA